MDAGVAEHGRGRGLCRDVPAAVANESRDREHHGVMEGADGERGRHDVTETADRDRGRRDGVWNGVGCVCRDHDRDHDHDAEWNEAAEVPDAREEDAQSQCEHGVVEVLRTA